ncbi:hypothetical protein TH61_05345 [Rufibacter sp. DG15C]|nr:hypothetical protein TH61_05345 [Rufibacter sp. DG15C]
MYRLLLLTLLATSSLGCEEEEDLPKPTQTGAGIMAARIGGKLWERSSSSNSLIGSGLRVLYTDGYFSIIGSGDKREIDASIQFQMTDVYRPGVYTLRERLPGIFSDAGSYGRVNDLSERNNARSYETTAAGTGTVTITKLDTQNKIISGTFFFRAANLNNPSEFMEVTDGRFDVKYD